MAARTQPWNARHAPDQFRAEKPTDFGNSLTVSSNQAPPNNNPFDLKPFEKFIPYFGNPTKPWARAWDSHDIQHQTLAEAYEGENVYLRELIIAGVKDAPEFFYRIAAPLKKMDSAMAVYYDEMRFHRSILDAVPEEGHTRLLTYSREQHRDYLRRYGLAILINIMTLGTDRGNEIFACQLKQLEVATRETIAFGCAWHILNHRPYEDKNTRFRSDPTGTDVDRDIQNELDRWACLAKDPHGAQVLLDECKEQMTQRGESPANLMIWAQGSLKYQPQAYYMTGKPTNLGEKSLVSELQSNGVAHYESRYFSTSKHGPVEDPFFRQRTIGGFNYMTNRHLSDVPPDQYKTSMMDIYVYSERHDGMVRMEYADVVKATGLYDWDAADVPITPMGEEYFSVFGSAVTWGKYLQEIDMLDVVVEKLLTDFAGPHGTELLAEFYKTFEIQFTSAQTIKKTKTRSSSNSSSSSTGTNVANNNNNDAEKGKAAKDAEDVDNEELGAEGTAVLHGSRTNAGLAWTVRDLQLVGSRGNQSSVDFTLAGGYPVLFTVHESGEHSLTLGNIKSRGPITQHMLDVYRTEHNLGDDLDADVFYNRLELSLAISGLFFIVRAVTKKMDSRVSQMDRAREICQQASDVWPRLRVHGTSMDSMAASWEGLMAAFDTEQQAVLREQSTSEDVIHALCLAVMEYIQFRSNNGANQSLDQDTMMNIYRRLQAVESQFNGPSDVSGFAILPARRILMSDFNRRSSSSSDQNAELAAALREIQPDVTRAWVDELAVVYRTILNKLDKTNSKDEANSNRNKQPLDAFQMLGQSFQKMYTYWLVKQRVSVDKDNILPTIDSEDELKSLIIFVAFIHRRLGGTTPSKIHNRMTAINFIVNGLLYSPDSTFHIINTQANSGILTQNLQNFTGLSKFIKKTNPSDNVKKWIESYDAVQEEITDAINLNVNSTLKESTQKDNEAADALPDTLAEINAEIITQWLLFHSGMSVACGLFWKWCIKRNIPVGIGVLLLRPNKTYRMGSAVYMHGGGKCAFTGIGHQFMRVGSDAARDLMYAQYTNYHKTIVWDNRKILVTADVLPSQYLGGNGVEIWDPMDVENDLDDFMRGVMTRDMFACAVPANWLPRDHKLDITGEHHSSIEASTVKDGTLHYPSAKVYANRWQWETSEYNVLNKTYFCGDDPVTRKHQTLCFQDVQFGYQWNGMRGGGDFSKVIIEKGHWGPDVYEGCARVRRGKEKYFAKPSYIATKQMQLVN